MNWLLESAPAKELQRFNIETRFVENLLKLVLSKVGLNQAQEWVKQINKNMNITIKLRLFLRVDMKLQ